MRIDAQARLLADMALQQKQDGAPQDKAALTAKAREFEAIFVQQVFKQMRKTVPEDGLLPRGNAEDVYLDLQDMEAARQLTAQRGIGLAEILVEQLQKEPD